MSYLSSGSIAVVSVEHYDGKFVSSVERCRERSCRRIVSVTVVIDDFVEFKDVPVTVSHLVRRGNGKRNICKKQNRNKIFEKESGKINDYRVAGQEEHVLYNTYKSGNPLCL